MIENVQTSVPDLVGRIDSIERETEAIYLRLGRVFQAVKAAVDASAHDADLSIQRVLHEHRGGHSAEAARRRSEGFIEDASRFFDKASQSEESFLRGVEESIGSLSRLDDVISRIKADSEEMEIISLNAMTVALKSGAAGRAFSVITDELKRLSGRTIRHADNLSMAGSSLLERLEALKATLVDLSAAQSTFFDAARVALERGFVALDHEVDDTAEALRRLSAEASSVRGPIMTIMQEVQLQDIIRQSLDHVRLSLLASGADGQSERASTPEAALAPVDLDEEQAFLGEITRLSSSLLDDVSAQVRASLERFRAGMDGVNAVMSSVEMARFAMVAERGGKRDTVDYSKKAEAYLVAKTRAIAESTTLWDNVRILDERFREMHSILARFRSIVTASRIETARNRALAIVSTTVTGMMDLTESLSANVVSAGEVTRSFSRALSRGMSEYLSGGTDTMAALRAEVAGLQVEFDRICQSRQNLWQAESDFRPFSDKFSEAVGEATGSVDRIAALAVELEDMRDSLASYAASMAGDGEAQTTSSIHSERLTSIVDRFTIFAHKQTAARIARLETGEEAVVVESGDVTLF